LIVLKFKRLDIETTQGHAGELVRESQFVFNYRATDPACEISLTMPLRARSYAANILPGVLRQNLPEGYLYFWIKEHFGKVAQMDDMNILAIAGRDAIGRVRCLSEQQPAENALTTGENLAEILTWKGTEDLFDYLVRRYALASGVSGVQPKVLLREKPQTTINNNVIDKSTLKSRGLIVKSAGDDYPGLAENEFICMSIARAAGLETPDFWLSSNRRLFVVQRFDYEDGRYLGFEDMTALMDRQADEKYTGSYEAIAKAVALFCSPDHVSASLAALFRAIALSVFLRNGDAHLKNFGLLYTHPHSDDCRLSPLYDVINTTAYIPKDTLALKLNKSKAWPSRAELIHFGTEHCRLDRPEEEIDRIVDAAMAFRPDEPSEIWEKMRAEIALACW
jgi:serine/threonine-protein kinase HipA